MDTRNQSCESVEDEMHVHEAENLILCSSNEKGRQGNEIKSISKPLLVKGAITSPNINWSTDND